jgi:hypothetical protein
MCGCDASGNAIQPDLGWNSCEPEYDTSSYPVFVVNTNANFVNLSANFATIRCLYVEGNNVTTNFIVRFCDTSYCKVHAKSTCTYVGSGLHDANSKAFDSVYQNDSTVFGTILGSDPFNCRSFATATGATWGTGIGNNNAPHILYKCTSYGAPLSQIRSSSVSQYNMTPYWFDNTFYDAGLTMAAFSLTGRNIAIGIIANNYFADATVGIDYLSFINCITINNRLRTFTTSTFSGTADNIFLFNQITGGTDADEFVNGTGGTSGDLTIKSTSTMWGRDYGVADQQPTGGGNRVGGFFFG